MSSRNGSSQSGSSRSSTPSVRQDTFRAHNSQNYMGDLTERRTSHGESVTFNHHARGYEHGAPTPTYHSSRTYPKPQ
ncbi:hypothetical protein F5Y09DRAFT_343232 [Xylaria sp. FL1042]|nr:hypothetical protein F5Y09DRAFT_343232 [Xylaria sp. FL1042]